MANYNGVIRAWFNGIVNDVANAGRGAVQESVDEGSSLVESRIRSLDRIDTGAMVGSVSGEVLSQSRDEVVGRFGFKDTPAYTVFQEYGTVNVSAMYSITDAADQVLSDLEGRVRSGL